MPTRYRPEDSYRRFARTLKREKEKKEALSERSVIDHQSMDTWWICWFNSRQITSCRVSAQLYNTIPFSFDLEVMQWTSSTTSSKRDWEMSCCAEKFDKLTRWLIKWFLTNLGFHVLGIRAAHGARERDAAVTKFNDRSSQIQVLMTSTRLSSTGYNLQYDFCEIA